MKQIKLEIKALSPLAISRQKPGGSVSECEDYIPGSVIRGAIASQILKQSGHQFSDLSRDGGDFQALFLSDEPAIFQNGYPSIKTKGKVIRKNQIEEIGVLPATVLSSKIKSGFTTENNNGVFDTLIDRYCAESYGIAYDPTCPNETGGRVEAFTGFYSKLGNKYHGVKVNKRLLTRVGINRRRATSEEEILYSIQVINESEINCQNEKPVIFNSRILVVDNIAEKLQNFINDNHKNFRLGGSTSRGLGKVEIKIINSESKEDENKQDIKEIIQEKVKEKIETFDAKLKTCWNQNWSIFGNPLKELSDKHHYFSLDLQSEAILTEKWQRTTVISASMLKLFTGIDDDSLHLEAAYSSYDYRSGWNSAWGLMKDVELVTDKGAVYLFSTTEVDQWYSALAELELKGVGERTSEGFGQIEVCNQFHLVMRDKPV